MCKSMCRWSLQPAGPSWSVFRDAWTPHGGMQGVMECAPFRGNGDFCGAGALECGMLRLQWELLPDIEQVNKAWKKPLEMGCG